jgi:D-cysteine desulfhydrase family pyridoxal phosphate-dependent enzyme
MVSKFNLAQLPTPVQKLSNLSRKLGGPEIYLKRDDLTGLAFGGNKTRKLEILISRALEEDANLVLTTGAAQSNHCRQTAAAAAAAGLDCRLILVGSEDSPLSGNLFLDQLLGAEIVWTSLEDRDLILQQEFNNAAQDGRRPYLIPYGGSNQYGAFAYLLAVDELKDQMVGNLPDWIVFASSSGGTQAGLAAGVYRNQLPISVLGVSVDEPEMKLKSKVADLAGGAIKISGSNHEFQPEEILVNADFTGGGYGVMNELERSAIRLFASEEGLLLDPVYTGRAAGGLISLIKDGYFSPEQKVMFWHTGGTPGLFAEQYLHDLL